MTTEKQGIAPHAASWAMLYLSLCTVSRREADATLVERMELASVLTMSKRHELVACVFEALKPFVGREELWQGSLPAWEHEVKLALRRAMLFQNEYASVRDFLEEAHISYMPLKGICLAPLYPALHLRDMSDVDIWYDSTQHTALSQFFLGRGYAMEETENHDMFTKPPVYNFEMHTALFSHVSSAQFANYYVHFNEKMQKNAEGCGYHFSREDMYIYLVLHEYRHALSGGVGVRYLLDRYLYGMTYATMDLAYIEGELERVGASAYYRDTEALISWLFADPARLFCQDVTEEEAGLLSLCESFVQAGAHGSYDRKVEQQLRRASGGGRITRRGRCKWMLRRLFPHAEYMRSYAARKCPRFFRPLPLAYVWRIFSAIGKIPRYLRHAGSIK